MLISKLFLLGLPAAIDRSILLPSDELVDKEREDEERRRAASVHVINDSSTSSAIHHQVRDHLIYARSCTL